MSAELSRFTFAPIESSRLQRIRRVVAELNKGRALTMLEIKKICNYSHVSTARDLAESIVIGSPDKLCIIPSKANAKTKTETRKLIV